MEPMPFTITKINTVGELKKAVKTCKAVYVWVNWQGEDGDYIEVSKVKFLRGIGCDAPCTGADGGLPDYTPCKAEIRDDELYVN